MPYNGGNRFRRGGGGGFRRNFGGPRQMHKITCSECGKEGEVPFKPREGTPVYCKDCFAKRKGLPPRTESNAEKAEDAEGSEDAEEVEEESEDETEEETEDETEDSDEK